MLYDPSTYTGIKGGTKFSDQDYQFQTPKPNNKHHKSQSKIRPSSGMKVEDRLMDYEKKRKLKLSQLQDQKIINHYHHHNKENQTRYQKCSVPRIISHTRLQSTETNTKLQSPSIKEVIKSLPSYQLKTLQSQSKTSSSILEQCMSNYLKKKQHYLFPQ